VSDGFTPVGHSNRSGIALVSSGATPSSGSSASLDTNIQNTLTVRVCSPCGAKLCWLRRSCKAAPRGYKHHPQPARFKETHDPLAAIAAYLRAVHSEAAQRGYAFDSTRIALVKPAPKIRCTEGQILQEFNHLKGKLRRRDRPRLPGLQKVRSPQAHPMFRIVRGDIEPWERS